MPGSKKVATDPSPRIRSGSSSIKSAVALNASQRIEHPLYGLSRGQLIERADQYCKVHGIDGAEDIRAFRIGSQLAGYPTEWDAIDEITDAEKDLLRTEVEKKWRQPLMLYFIVVSTCSVLVVEAVERVSFANASRSSLLALRHGPRDGYFDDYLERGGRRDV